MINGKFLRRIEFTPSADLASRRDLYEYQTTVSLEPVDWERLVFPLTAADKVLFHQIHRDVCTHYRKYLRSYNPSHLFVVTLPPLCVNKDIYNLCLINRIRYDENYPLITFEEEDWVQYITYKMDPALKDKFEFFLREHMINE